MKNLAITDQHAYIEFISQSNMGSVHDKTIWDELDLKLSDHNLLADLGFVGIEKSCPNAILPFKKPRGKELTELQKRVNKAIGSARIRIEHAFSGVKRLKIIRNKIRLETYQVRDRVFKIAVALHNLRVSYRVILNQP
ncbi:MAG: transposase [Cyclobacteriaceae bacterium]